MYLCVQDQNLTRLACSDVGVLFFLNRTRGGMTLFLQLDAVLGPAKATLGEAVDTSFGSGVIRAYATRSDTYTVDMGKRSALLSRLTAAYFWDILWSKGAIAHVDTTDDAFWWGIVLDRTLARFIFVFLENIALIILAAAPR